MRPRKFYQREIATAHHEAAHAIVAHSLGVRISYAYVIPGTRADLQKRGVSTWGMCCLVEADLHKLSDDDAHFLHLAPGPAESRLRVERGLKPLVVDYPSDLGKVLNSLMKDEPPDARIPGPVYRHLDALQERARAFVADDANWRAIRAVAEALLDACIIQGKPAIGNAAIVAAIASSEAA